MIKTLEKIIGQPEVKGALNEIIVARNYADKREKSFQHRPLLFTGLTGLGKSFMAEAFAGSLASAGFQYAEVPVKAGWRFFEQLSLKVCSVDFKTGEGSAIPSVIFVDEAHEPSPIEEMIKLITGTKHARMFERNGVKYFHDPHQHQWIFATNEEPDPAQKRRCLEIPFTVYDRGDKKKLLSFMCDKTIEDSALEYLEGRVKPTAGEIDNLCARLNLQPVDRIRLTDAKTVVQRIGLFPMGLVRKDLELLLRMAHDKKPTPIDTLKAKIGDVKTSATRSRLGWLMALELCEIGRGGYSLTTTGLKYLKDLADQQKKNGKGKK